MGLVPGFGRGNDIGRGDFHVFFFVLCDSSILAVLTIGPCWFLWFLVGGFLSFLFTLVFSLSSSAHYFPFRH